MISNIPWKSYKGDKYLTSWNEEERIKKKKNKKRISGAVGRITRNDSKPCLPLLSHRSSSRFVLIRERLEKASFTQEIFSLRKLNIPQQISSFKDTLLKK